MSLRTVHLVLVLTAIVFAALFGAWSILTYPATGSSTSLWLGIGTLLGGLALSGYAIRYVRRMESVDLD